MKRPILPKTPPPVRVYCTRIYIRTYRNYSEVSYKFLPRHNYTYVTEAKTLSFRLTKKDIMYGFDVEIRNNTHETHEEKIFQYT